MTIKSDYVIGYDNGWRDGVKDYKKKNKPATPPTTGSAPVANAQFWGANASPTLQWIDGDEPKAGTRLQLYAPPANAPVTSVEQMIRAAKRFAVHWSGRSPANQDEAEAVLRKALLAASMGGDKS